MVKPEPTEENLIKLAQRGDKEAFALLIYPHQQFVYNLILHIAGNISEAEDIAQEALIRAWLALPGFQSKARFRTWLYRIVTNLCYNQMAQLRRELAYLHQEENQHEDFPTLLENMADNRITNDPAGRLLESERQSYLHRQIDLLSPSYKLLIVLRYREELPYDEIAHILEIPVGTVKTGLFRARAILKEKLHEFEEGRIERIC